VGNAEAAQVRVSDRVERSRETMRDPRTIEDRRSIDDRTVISKPAPRRTGLSIKRETRRRSLPTAGFYLSRVVSNQL
jgi:hypothetical protein